MKVKCWNSPCPELLHLSMDFKRKKLAYLFPILSTSVMQLSLSDGFKATVIIKAQTKLILSRYVSHMTGKATSGLEMMCGVLVMLKELKGRMDRCTGRRDITEMLLKMVLNTIKSIKTLVCVCD